MRGLLSICLGLAACGGSAIAPATSPARPPAPITLRADDAGDGPIDPIDPIAALAPVEAPSLSWVVPGPLQLELGGQALPPGGSGRPIEVQQLERQGNLVRAAVRLEHARFAAWIDRANLLLVLKRDQRIERVGAAVGSDVQVVLHAGAPVQRLAHREHKSQIRYLGAVQVEGWVPDRVLDDRGPARDGVGRIPTGRKTLMVIPGAVIRTEPRWAASELATMANGYFLDTIRVLDEAWTEVGYEDGDVALRGFVSRRDPPGRLHHWKETDGTAAVTPNATVASGTCLYARTRGEPVGYVVGNRPVELEDTGAGWWAITLDTPWGPIAFAGQGASRTELAACAPSGSVPSPTP